MTNTDFIEVPFEDSESLKITIAKSALSTIEPYIHEASGKTKITIKEILENGTNRFILISLPYNKVSKLL